MSNWREIYREAAGRLKEAGFAEAEAEARILVAHVCGCDFSQLCLRFFDVCNREEEVRRLLQERLTGRPLAYVLGEKYFYGRPFLVNEHVLIPRFDTECVTQRALELAAGYDCRTVLDLCCGSGCIGVTMAAEGALEEVWFADCSPEALRVAKKNAMRLVPRQAVQMFCGDFTDAVPACADMVICNPPYISREDYETLEPQVREYEPQSALVAENDGYFFYQKLADHISEVLRPGGALVLEIGDSQAETVCALLKEAGFFKIECGVDLAQRPRWVSAWLPGKREEKTTAGES